MCSTEALAVFVVGRSRLLPSFFCVDSVSYRENSKWESEAPAELLFVVGRSRRFDHPVVDTEPNIRAPRYSFRSFRVEYVIRKGAIHELG